MSTVAKADSVKSGDPSLKGSSSFFGNKSSRSSKNSFSRVISRLRGIGRRSFSHEEGATSGQVGFLDSISKMSDSDIVENWLLSLDAQSPEVEPPEQLLRPVSGCTRSQGVTPTNEPFDPDTTAVNEDLEGRRVCRISESSVAGEVGVPDPSRILFHQPPSSEDEESGGELQTERRPSSAPPNRQGYGRQVSECSEYTTDTHDTGETAQETARNTITNTQASFTSQGEEIRKGTSFECPDQEVAAINSEWLEAGRRPERRRRGSGESEGRGSEVVSGPSTA
jgi:hypothetical protein